MIVEVDVQPLAASIPTSLRRHPYQRRSDAASSHGG